MLPNIFSVLQRLLLLALSVLPRLTADVRTETPQLLRSCRLLDLLVITQVVRPVVSCRGLGRGVVLGGVLSRSLDLENVLS